MRSPVLLSTLLLITTSFIMIPFMLPTAHAATGTVCITGVGTTGCPATPSTLNAGVGTTLTIHVNVQSSDKFNGFDISILAPHDILQPSNASITGSVVPSPQVAIASCVGGVGTGCTLADTADTVHVAAISLGSTTTTPTTGLLFSATYNVISAGGLVIGYQTGCSPSSVAGTTMCLTVANGTASPVPEIGESATFSTDISPSFAMSMSPSSLGILQGQSSSSKLTLTSVNGFAGSIDLAAASSSSGIQASINPATISLTTIQVETSNVTIAVSSSAAPGIYTVTVSGNSLSISNSAQLSVTVIAAQPSDFQITAFPKAETVPPGISASFNIFLASLSQIPITISMTGSAFPVFQNGPVVSFSPTSIQLTPGSSGSITMTVSTSASTPQTSYTILATGSTISITRSQTVQLTVAAGPPADFTITASPASLKIPRDSTGSSTINVGVVNGFVGIISLTATVSAPGATATLTPSTVTAPGFAALAVKAISTGNYLVNITGTSGPLSHSVIISVSVIPVGLVCIVPSTATSCPTFPALITGTAGSQLVVSVLIQDSAGINGFDIGLSADHNILKPHGVFVIGTILPGPTTILDECIGGVLIAGTGTVCFPTDTVDTIHLALASAPGTLTPTPSTGLLFTAIYDVLQSTAGTIIDFQTGCGTFTSQPPLCVTLANGDALALPAKVQNATFKTTATADFTIAASQTTIHVDERAGRGVLQLYGTNGFSGRITLEATFTPNSSHDPTASLRQASIVLTGTKTGTVTLVVRASDNTTPGTYLLTVKAASGTISHSITLRVIVS